MPSTFTTSNKLEQPATGEQSGVWGITANTDYSLIDTALDGVEPIVLSGTTATLNIGNATVSNPDGRARILLFTGSPGGDCTVTVTPNSAEKWYWVQNNTSGGFNVIMKQGSGSTATVTPGGSQAIYVDGGGSGASAKVLMTGLKLSALETPGLFIDGAVSGTTQIAAQSAASGVVSLPAATDTLVGRATTDTFTNKSISGSTNTLTSIANASLVNSSITINGVVSALGASVTINPSLSTLTIGTGLSGTSYNGSAPVTIAIDGTVATLTGAQTLTNKAISGSSNTITSIANASLTNSSMTLNGTLCTLGGSFTIGGGGGGGATLTIGNGLSGGSYDGSTGVTIAINTSVTADLSTAQTLSNKNLTTCTLTTSLVAGAGLTYNGSSSGGTIVKASAAAGSTTLTLPAATDTLVGKATTDTLTNKTMNFASNTITNIPNSALAFSSITINGTPTALGGTATITIGSLGGLSAANNLSDVVSASSSRSNIGANDASNLSTGTLPVARLPIATSSVVGAVKIGTGLSVDGSGNVTANALTYGIGSAVSSGTSGSILYVNGSAQLAQDNAHLFYDASNVRFNLNGPAATDSRMNINGGTLAAGSSTQVLLQKWQTSDIDNRSLQVFEFRDISGGSGSSTAYQRIQRKVNSTLGPYVEFTDTALNLGQVGTTTGALVSVENSSGNLRTFASFVGGAGAISPCTIDSSGHINNASPSGAAPGQPIACGSAYCTGTTWTNGSSVASKENFEEVNTNQILEKVADMPLKAWNYLTEKPVKHIGWFAEDFHNAFGYGDDARSISTVDGDGVLVACIKALVERVKKLEAMVK